MHRAMLRGPKVPNAADIQKQRVSYQVALGSAYAANRVVMPEPPCHGCPDMVGRYPAGEGPRELKPFKPMTMKELQERKKKSNFEVANII